MSDQERYGGLLDYLQWADRPHGGENPALGGMLGMLARLETPQPSFSTVNGGAAVDKLLSGGDPSRRFRVYRRKMLSDEVGNAKKTLGSLAHWLFISEDGKEGFGFNQDGEVLELPESLEGYELHPAYADRTFTAAGLNNARRAREHGIAARYQFAEDNPWLFQEYGEMPDLIPYRRFLNNCQHYVNEIAGYYQE